MYYLSQSESNYLSVLLSLILFYLKLPLGYLLHVLSDYLQATCSKFNK